MVGATAFAAGITMQRGWELPRDYAHSAMSAGGSEAALVASCAADLARCGFCVIDHVIPPEAVAAVRAEVAAATPAIYLGREDGAGGGRRVDLADGSGERAVDGCGVRLPPGGSHELLHFPLFAEHLGHPAVLGLARAVLDPHIRVAQFHIRHVPPDRFDDGEPSNSRPMPSGRGKRGCEACTAPPPPPPHRYAAAIPPRGPHPACCTLSHHPVCCL